MSNRTDRNFGFQSQSALHDHIAAKLEKIGYGVDFTWPFLSCIFAARDPVCLEHKLSPTAFRMLLPRLGRSSYTFQMEVAGMWQDASWNKCVAPGKRNPEAWFSSWLRAAVMPQIEAYRHTHLMCAHADCHELTAEIDHADPPFDAFADDFREAVVGQLGSIAALMASPDLQQQYAGVARDVHAGFKLQALCLVHHREKHKMT